MAIGIDRSTQPGDRAPADDVRSAPHRRYNPLIDEWVLVSADRTQRPWQGDELPPTAEDRPAYDPDCYLCPGNARAGAVRNPDYARTFVFTNDFAALRPDTGTGRTEDGLLISEGERGTCRVICFTPRHDLTLARLDRITLRDVIDLWAEQTTELGSTYRWVQVFENRGAAMGASNPHPHGQIWAGSALPREAAREDTSQRGHHGRTGRRLLLDYAAQESGGPRVVFEDDDWLVVVPFWASWPFETMIVAKQYAGRLADLASEVRDTLAVALRALLTRYDNLFRHPFPYSMGWHQAPFGDDDLAHWQLHAHFYPPLLRSATVRKFMVGYELLAEAQRDLTPEQAVERLRDVSDQRDADVVEARQAAGRDGGGGPSFPSRPAPEPADAGGSADH
jgi:UDPglucose--hexose-1-phosphate uridylyltransferase